MFLYWLTTVLSSFLIGVALTLFLQYYLYKKYFSDKECFTEENRVINEPLLLPKIFVDLIRNSDIPPSDSCMAVNLLLQFLFHELRDTEKVRKWFRKKLSLEFEQLLASSAISRMIADIKIREIHLGSEFPVLTNIGVQDVKVNENYSHIDTLDLKLDLSYSGNFRLVIDVVLLGKSAYVSIAVNELYGEGRLQFSRLPYSHWSFTFYNEPKLQLDVISQFQGRAYQQVTTLISNQIRRALKKKHTLPNYKLRYKPFFDVHHYEPKIGNATPGQVKLTIHRISRLNEELANNREIYALAATDALPWVEIRNYCNCNFAVLDILTVKKSHALGLNFKSTFIEEKEEYCLVLDEIKPGGISCEEGLNPGDIVVSVDGKKVNSLSQLNKLLKSVPAQFVLRIERKLIKENPEESAVCSTPSTPSTFSNCPVYTGLRRRKGSESESCGSTPSASLPGSPARRNYFRNPLESPKIASIVEQEVVHHCDEICRKINKTKSLWNNQILVFDDVFNFNVNSDEKYLNINVRAKENESQSDKLLGYLNIPLCNLDTSEDYLRSLFLKPPDSLASNSRNHKLSCQNGFNPSLCYGDIVLSLQYFPSSQISASPPAGKIPEIIEPHLTKSDSTDSLQDSISVLDKKHNFVRTHFTASTQCDFCGKKIWLKDAERCRECGMSIHKKCVAKCHSESVCLPQQSISKLSETEMSGSTSSSGNIESPKSSTQKMLPKLEVTPEDTSPQVREEMRQEDALAETSEATPEDPFSSCLSECPSSKSQMSTPKKGLGGLLANVASRSLKRVGSANNLALPGGQFPSFHSKSLPPSPQQSPAPSRKPSLPTDLSDEILSVLETLMQQGCNHGDLMYFAKESGKTLYENLDLAERKEKIQDMVNKLKCAINAEVESRFSLEKEEQTLVDPNAKARVAFLIGKSDEKTQALTILMLHFCAGLQHIQDLEDQEKEINVTGDTVQNAQ